MVNSSEFSPNVNTLDIAIKTRAENLTKKTLVITRNNCGTEGVNGIAETYPRVWNDSTSLKN